MTDKLLWGEVMLDEKYIKPIPNYIAKRIRSKDKIHQPSSYIRFYAYLTKMKGELVKVTVACKDYKNQWFCRQVSVHGVDSDNCLVRDLEYISMGYSVGWYELGLSKQRKRFEDGKWYSRDYKYYNPPAYIVNKKYALKYVKYKYSAIDKYPYWDVLKYLRVYKQYPHAEYFIKIGLQHLATNKTLLKKAAKDKNFRKWLIRNARLLRNEYGKYPYFTTQVVLYAYRENTSLMDGFTRYASINEALNDYDYTHTISKVIDKQELPTFIDYVKNHDVNISSYKDYVNACIYLGLDMSIPKNRYPHDFKRWHDIRIDEYRTARALKDEEERKELYTKFADVATKYLPLQRYKEDTFIAVIAKSPDELIREGDLLHHCVGRMNYDQKFAREESLIFFIRNANEPDTPFVTVEYSLKNKKVLQCYGKGDNKPSDSVLEYVNKKWLPFANRQLKKIQQAA